MLSSPQLNNCNCLVRTFATWDSNQIAVTDGIIRSRETWNADNQISIEKAIIENIKHILFTSVCHQPFLHVNALLRRTRL